MVTKFICTLEYATKTRYASRSIELPSIILIYFVLQMGFRWISIETMLRLGPFTGQLWNIWHSITPIKVDIPWANPLQRLTL